MHSNLSLAIKKNYWFLLLSTLIALCIRVLWFASYTQHENYRITIDSGQYQEVALQVAQKNQLTKQDGSPNFFRLPAYPLFLGTFYKIFGHKPQKTLCIQVILSTFVIPLIFALSHTLSPNILVVSKIATLAAALHPGFILFSGMQSTETLFLLFFLLFLIFFFQGIKNNRLSYFCIAGLSLAVASLFRAFGHFVLILSLILLFLLFAQKILRRLSAASILTSSWLALFGLWLARNYILTGFIFVHTLTGQHFLRYNAVHILMDVKKTSWQEPHAELFALRDTLAKQQETRMGRKLLEIERDNIALKIAQGVIKKHPYLALKHASKNVLRTIFSLHSLKLFQLPSETIFTAQTSFWFKLKKYLSCLKTYPFIILFLLWDMLFSFLLFLGIIFFVFFSFKNKNLWKIWLATFPFITLLLGITLSYGEARLRFPAEPFLIILASYGLYQAYFTYKKHLSYR